MAGRLCGGKRTRGQFGFAALALVTMAAPAAAQEPSAAIQQEIQAAWRAAGKVAQKGPIDIPLAGQGTIHLPAAQAFVPIPQAAQVMTALGNSADPHMLGLIVSTEAAQNWMGVLDWTAEGHVPDGDASEWKPDALLTSLREGTEAQNQEREKRGFPPLNIIGWVEAPAYDAVTHRLVWSLAATDRGAPVNAQRGINYNTYALGREGYVSLDMLTDSTHVAHDRGVARDLLGRIDFMPGKRYQDFNPATDRVAEYGLAALVGVVAAKKLGLLAMVGIFLLKAWKLAMVALLGGWAALRRGFKRFFGREQEPDAYAPSETDHGGEPPIAGDILPDSAHG